VIHPAAEEEEDTFLLLLYARRAIRMTTGSNTHMSSPEKQIYPSWHNAVAGGVAGLASRMATAPLDLIRIRRQLAVSEVIYPSESIYQTWTNIVKNEGGVTALFRGNMAAVYLWVGYSAVQFSLYNSTKEYLQKSEMMHFNSTMIAFTAGATAGSFATLASYPLDVCRTAFAARGKYSKSMPLTTMSSRQATAAHMPFSSLVEPCFKKSPAGIRHTVTPPISLADFAAKLYQQRGLTGFYAGVGPAIVQIIPYMGLSFAIYEYLTTDNHVVGSAYAGSISGAFSKIVVYPLDTVKRRMQGQALSYGNYYYRNTTDCIVTIFREEGCFAFYKGIVPAVMKSAIATGLTFAFFRLTKNTLEDFHNSG
jgi:solute carrier family 25 thiamine pyrophosphate transporter 19